MIRTSRILFAGLLMLACASAQAQESAQRVRGEVVVQAGNSLTVKTATGEALSIRLTDTARVTQESRVDLMSIVPGVYVGATSVPQPDGTLRAVQIRIFPEALRGIGEGHRPLTPQGGSTMTNATVSNMASPSSNTMTNATVSKVAGESQARTMVLKYKEGEKLVIIPDDVVVIQTEIVDRSALVPGAHVVVTATRQSDGSLSAERVTVGKAGSVPM